MKIYNLDIDTSKPVRQVVNIPVDTQKYGLAVNCTADGKRISSPYCTIIDNGNTLSATTTLDDGSFLFELSATAGDGGREVIIYALNTDELSASTWDGALHTYTPHGDDEDNTDLGSINRVAAIWYKKKGTGTGDIPAEYFADDELITFTAETHIGHTVTKRKGAGVWQEWEDLFVVPAGKYYPRELDRAVLGGSIGLPANCKAKVVLKPSKAASPDFVVEDTAESVTIGGVVFSPTTISVDGTDYVVLAAAQEEPEPEPDPEP